MASPVILKIIFFYLPTSPLQTWLCTKSQEILLKCRGQVRSVVGPAIPKFSKGPATPGHRPPLNQHSAGLLHSPRTGIPSCHLQSLTVPTTQSAVGKCGLKELPLSFDLNMFLEKETLRFL